MELPLARLVELALVVPVEVGTRLIEAVPVVVDKVPSAADRVRREIVLARFIGKLAVDQGLRELRARLSPGDEAEAGHDGTAAHTGPPVQDNAVESPRPEPVDRPDVYTLALVDYDHLSSAQIVAKLDGLDAAERAAIEAYERAGRHRRTIMGKLEQLAERDS